MSRKRKRESKARRWKRKRETLRFEREAGVRPGRNHERIDLEPLEFACLFTVEGGRDKIGDAFVRAVDRFGRRPGKPVAPRILDIERDKASKLMAYADDAETLRLLRMGLRDERSQRQSAKLLSAFERNAVGWYRQDVPDQTQRSILMGTNGGDPERSSDGTVVCFKLDSETAGQYDLPECGKYAIAREYWDGGWSVPDADGHRERVGVSLDVLEHDGHVLTFRDKDEAQRAFMLAIDECTSSEDDDDPMSEFSDIRDAGRIESQARKLRVWERNGTDMKALYERPKSEPENKPGRAPSNARDVRVA